VLGGERPECTVTMSPCNGCFKLNSTDHVDIWPARIMNQNLYDYEHGKDLIMHFWEYQCNGVVFDELYYGGYYKSAVGPLMITENNADKWNLDRPFSWQPNYYVDNNRTANAHCSTEKLKDFILSQSCCLAGNSMKAFFMKRMSRAVIHA